MKDLDVLKKLLLLCSILFSSSLCSDTLSEILSANKQLLFEYEFQENSAKSDMLENSWINPILIQYSRNYSEQFAERTVETGSFSVGIDQPIFRSGGIYYAIKYASTLREENNAQIRLKKQEMIAQAVKLLFEIKKVKLERQKMNYLIQNDKINIRQKEESYKAGLIDSSFLDQAILNKNKDETTAITLEMKLASLEQSFALLSDKNPNTLKLPWLHLISAQRYKGSNLELVRDRLKVKEKGYSAKMTWAKYLPSVSLQGRYTDADINPLFDRPDSGLNERYWTYGFTISMPLNINMFSDIESAKVAHLKAQTEVIEKKEAIESEYKLVRNNLKLIEKQIQLAAKDKKLYKRLYKVTQNQVKSGEKTKWDAKMMYHALKIRGIDKQIHQIDKQIELLKLYTKVVGEI